MSDEAAYRRTGRGGAGNYYTQKDVEEASSRAVGPDDIEAQKQNQLLAPTTDGSSPYSSTAPTTTANARTSGRGGAGNFIDTSSTTTSTTTSTSSPSNTSALHSTTNPKSASPIQHSRSTSTSTPTPTPRSTGRGGAGNYASTTSAASSGGGRGERGGVYDAEQERKRQAALDADILRDIRDSLPQVPPKIHYMHRVPGKGRRPGDDLNAPPEI